MGFNLHLARDLASKLEITGSNQIFPRTHDGIFFDRAKKGSKWNQKKVKREDEKEGATMPNFQAKKKKPGKGFRSPGVKDPFQFPLKFSNRVGGTDGSTTSAKCFSSKNWLFFSFFFVVTRSIDNNKKVENSVFPQCKTQKSNERDGACTLYLPFVCAKSTELELFSSRKCRAQ